MLWKNHVSLLNPTDYIDVGNKLLEPAYTADNFKIGKVTHQMILSPTNFWNCRYNKGIIRTYVTNFAPDFWWHKQKFHVKRSDKFCDITYVT